jgi:UDP-glucose 4-epimerase
MKSPVSLEEGLARMADWAKRTGPRRGEEFADIELTRGLPPVWLEA